MTEGNRAGDNSRPHDWDAILRTILHNARQSGHLRHAADCNDSKETTSAYPEGTHSPLKIHVEGEGTIRINGEERRWGHFDGLWIRVAQKVSFSGSFTLEIVSAARRLNCSLKLRSEPGRETSIVLRPDSLELSGWDGVKLRDRSVAFLNDCREVSAFEDSCLTARTCHFVRTYDNCRYDLTGCAVVESWEPSSGRVHNCKIVQCYGKSGNPPMWD